MVTATTSQPARQRKPRPKPQRFIRLGLAPFQGNPGVVTVAVQKSANRREVTEYFLWPMPSDFGTAFRLEKRGEQGGERYHVLLDLEEGKHSCECKGFLRWGHCKHTEGLAALVQVGQLEGGRPQGGVQAS